MVGCRRVDTSAMFGRPLFARWAICLLKDIGQVGCVVVPKSLIIGLLAKSQLGSFGVTRSHIPQGETPAPGLAAASVASRHELSLYYRLREHWRADYDGHIRYSDEV